MYMSIIANGTVSAKTDESNVDIREQLFNDCECGIIEQVSTATYMVKRIHGILLDLDICRLKAGSIIPDPSLPAEQLYEEVISKWLDHHAALRNAEVRATGNGLHIIVRPDKPIEFRSEEDRSRWEAITRIIRRVLPTDPEHRGINGLTRKVGSINGKNGATVKLLKSSEGVPAELIAKFAEEIAEQPFKSMVQVLTGSEHATCPLCKEQRMLVLPTAGRCYGCGPISIGTLIDTMITDKPQAGRKSKEARDAS
jgi:hypothetical protein